MKALKTLFLTLAIGTLLNVASTGPGKDQPGKDQPSVKKDGGTDQMKANLMGLYDALHAFALPDTDPSRPVSQRFIMQIPGKVLNPKDYYPGKEYEDYLRNPHKASHEVHIPPIVTEKMFQLSDIVPGANPMTGGETGISLARLYERILGSLDVLDFTELIASHGNVYKEALDKLLEFFPDPDDPTKNSTLLELYSRFRDAYHKEQWKMEETIKEKEKEMKAVEYQAWFQRHFELLNSNVEGAYTRWLLYGRKHLVESYIAHFDTTSSGELLEDARIKLRSSAFTSQDRSQQVYPVTFTPSNWYQHLNPKKEAKPTRDQLQTKLESVKTKITLLKAMQASSTEELKEDKRAQLKKQCDETNDKLTDSIKKYKEAHDICWLENTCEIGNKQQKVVDALKQNTDANLHLELLEFQFGAKSQLKSQIDVILARLELEKTTLEDQISKSEPSSGSPMVDDLGTTEELDLEEIQDNWALFEYTSTKAEKETSQSSVQSSTKASVSSWIPFYPGASVSTSAGRKSFSEHLRSADVKVKAKVLKVKINRPWFRADLFRNEEYKLHNQSVRVSPGSMVEETFYKEVTKENYLLYQYPTAFLMAKEVTMEFSGLDASTKQSALSASVGVAAKGSYGPFTFGGSTSTAGSHSSMKASSTANGLKIDIPGAQLIGYYCDVVPEFPKN